MRTALGVILALLAVALLVYGLTIVVGDPYDVGRAGVVTIGAFFLVPGLAAAAGAWLLLRPRRSA